MIERPSPTQADKNAFLRFCEYVLRNLSPGSLRDVDVEAGCEEFAKLRLGVPRPAFDRPWSTEVEDNGDLIRINILLADDYGPVRHFRPYLDIDLDEAHATELLGKLALELDRRRRGVPR